MRQEEEEEEEEEEGGGGGRRKRRRQQTISNRGILREETHYSDRGLPRGGRDDIS
jgi:hypothetical protein